MQFPEYRARRMRRTETLRRLVRETRLSTDHLVYPLFVVPGSGVRNPVRSMPGVFQLSVDEAAKEARVSADLGIPGVILFGIPEQKDARGTDGYSDDGVVQQATRAIKEALGDRMLVMTDVCLCAYTDHGHCGVLGQGGVVLNDPSLPHLTKMAIAHAEAGADVVAPSDMMDGRIGAMREGLDAAGFEETAILSYAAKFASGYYGPFRDAAASKPAAGDRKSYQADWRSGRGAIRDALLDEAEGADMLMVKPALAYLDIIAAIRNFSRLPVVCYNVSGEYSMVKLAAREGLCDLKTVVLENLTAMRRAGADRIITYHAREALGERWI